MLLATQRHGLARALAASMIVATVCTGCGSADDATNGTPGSSSSNRPVVAPDSCEDATETLDDVVAESVRLSLLQDETGAALLVQNTGESAVVVVPDPVSSTYLLASPHANPTDDIAVAALEATAGSGVVGQVEGLPPGVPPGQLFLVPPGWAVCALTGDPGSQPRVQYQRDRAATAAYYLTSTMMEAAEDRVAPRAPKAVGAMTTCARGAAQLASGDAPVDTLTLYAQAVGTGSACRSGYQALFVEGEEAAQGRTARALTLLERSPRLIQNTRAFISLFR